MRPDLDLPQGFGIRPADGDSAFHWLYWGKCPVGRTRDAERLVTALERHLSVPRPSGGDRVILHMSACVDGNGYATLLPRLGDRGPRFDSRLRAAGMMLVDTPHAVIDPGAGELIVEEPTVRLAPRARDALLEELGTTKRQPIVETGRYRILRLLVERDRRTPAQVLAMTLGASVDPMTAGGAHTVSVMLERLRTVVVAMRDVGTIVDAVRRQPN